MFVLGLAASMVKCFCMYQWSHCCCAVMAHPADIIE